LESSWRGLHKIGRRTNFREKHQAGADQTLPKQGSLEDFEDSREIVQSGLYKHVYSR